MDALIAKRIESMDRTPSPTISQPTQVDSSVLNQKRLTPDFGGKVDGGGYKQSMDDPKKLPLWLVPGALVRAAARVLGYGAKKYAANNWRRGMKWSEVLSALDRHLQALKDGEMYDVGPGGSGHHHLDHLICNASFLAEYIERPEYQSFNDLFIRNQSESK